MTYIGLLTSCMLGNIRLNSEYFTDSGSSHGAKHLFAEHIAHEEMDENYKNKEIDLEQWHAWHKNALQSHSINGNCVIRDGWCVAPPEMWTRAIESLDDATVIISSPNSKLDWIYCWLNMTDKIPKHVYYTLQRRSEFYPVLWAKDKLKLLPKHVKIQEMIRNMPIHPISEDIKIREPFRFSTTEILHEDFPHRLMEYLSRKGFDIKLDSSILDWHRLFISNHIDRYERALLISQGKDIISRGPFDDILLGYLTEDDPWTTEGHPK